MMASDDQACIRQAEEQRAAAEAVAARQPAGQLARAIHDRGWRMGLPQLSVGARSGLKQLTHRLAHPAESSPQGANTEIGTVGAAAAALQSSPSTTCRRPAGL